MRELERRGVDPELAANVRADDPAVRELVGRTLNRDGYRVLLAESGQRNLPVTIDNSDYDFARRIIAEHALADLGWDALTPLDSRFCIGPGEHLAVELVP